MVSYKELDIKHERIPTNLKASVQSLGSCPCVPCARRDLVLPFEVGEEWSLLLLLRVDGIGHVLDMDIYLMWVGRSSGVLCELVNGTNNWARVEHISLMDEYTR